MTRKITIPYEQGEIDFAISFPARFRLDVITMKLNAKFGNFRPKQAIANMRCNLNHRMPKGKYAKTMVADKKQPEPELLIYVPDGKADVLSCNLIRAMNNTDTSLHGVAKLTGLDVTSLRVLLNKGGIPAPYSEPVRVFYAEKGEVV